jgi:hypothetical protein
MDPFATIEDIELLWRPLSDSETTRAGAMLPVVSDTLRQAAKDKGLNLDDMIEAGDVFINVVKSVVVDVIRRYLTQSDAQPITQMSQSAGGYSESATYLTPSYGILVYDNELARIGIRRKQRITMIEADLGIFDRKSDAGDGE